MHFTWLAWLAALLGVGGTLFFMQRARNISTLAQVRQAELEAQLADRERALAATQQKLAQQRERNEELAELRQRVEKLKKRAKQVIEEGKNEPERVSGLEGQLAELRRDLALAQREREQAHRAIAQLEAQHVAERREHESRLEAAGRAEESASLRTQLAAAEARIGELEDGAAKSGAELERFRRRWENVDKAYMVLRGEKAALEDELRTKTERIERLESLKVALLDAEAPQERG